MATISKFYLLDAATPNTGTMPGAAENMWRTTTNVAASDVADARTARDATDTPGASNPDIEITVTSSGASGVLESFGYRRFVSRPLAAQTIAAGTWTFSYARSESNLNHNQSVACHPFVWRPSTGLLVAHLMVSAMTGTEPTAAGAVEAESVTNINGLAVAILDGDIVVLDVTTEYNQAMAVVYTETFSYNGTTEASTTTCASFVTPPSALTLFEEAVIPSPASAGFQSHRHRLPDGS